MPGKPFEDFHVDEVMEHEPRVQVTQEDNVAFCRLTHNTQPIHLDPDAAKASPVGRILVNGLLTMSLAVGVSVEDTTSGTLVANLGYEEVQHPHPVFPGDILAFRTRVAATRASSKPGRGIVTLAHEVHNQDHVLVCTFKRVVLVRGRA